MARRLGTIRNLFCGLLLFHSVATLAGAPPPAYEDVSKMQGRVDEVEKHLCAHPTPPSQANCPNNEQGKGGVEGAAASAHHLQSAAAIRRELDFYKAFGPYYNSQSQDSVEGLEANLKNQQMSLDVYQKNIDQGQAKVTAYGDFVSQLKSTNVNTALSDPNSDIITTMKNYFIQRTNIFQNQVMSVQSAIKYEEDVLAKTTTNTNAFAYSNIDAYKADLLAKKKNLENLTQQLEAAQNVSKCLDDHTTANCASPAADAIQKWAEDQSSAINNNLSYSEKNIEFIKKTISDLETKLALLKEKNAAADSDEANLQAIEAFNSPNLKVILDAHKADRCGMSNGELLAIHYYTQNGYQNLNRALRNGGDDLQKVQPIVDELNSALKKLAPFDGYVIRGGALPDDVKAQHTVGSIVTYKAFTSTSLNSGFMSPDRFVIHSRRGRYVGSYSASYGEAEILFAAGTKFKVISVVKKDGTPTIYTLDEIVP